MQEYVLHCGGVNIVGSQLWLLRRGGPLVEVVCMHYTSCVLGTRGHCKASLVQSLI